MPKVNKQNVTPTRCGTEPFLRWAGSKRKLLPRLTSYWDSSYKRYIEPFAGSACLFFAINPATAIVGDLNRDLIQTFRQVRKHPHKVSSILKRLRRNKKEYYRVRTTNNSELSPEERAARFIYLNRYCFNGIYRTNMQGKFNVPYSPSRTGDLPTSLELNACSRALRKARIIGGDFEKCLQDIRGGDFVYLDPPYAVSSRRVFREYGPKPFNNDDLERLANSLIKVDDAGAHFVLSYAYSHEAIKWFRQWRPKKIRTVRNMAGFNAKKKFAFEILATNIGIWK